MNHRNSITGWGKRTHFSGMSQGKCEPSLFIMNLTDVLEVPLQRTCFEGWQIWKQNAPILRPPVLKKRVFITLLSNYLKRRKNSACRLSPMWTRKETRRKQLSFLLSLTELNQKPFLSYAFPPFISGPHQRALELPPTWGEVGRLQRLYQHVPLGSSQEWARFRANRSERHKYIMGRFCQNLDYYSLWNEEHSPLYPCVSLHGRKQVRNIIIES